MLEINVDVRRFVARGADESLKQHVNPVGINGRDAQAIADGGIRGGAAPLTENPARASKADQIVDREEVRLDLQIFDQRQFMDDLLADLFRNALRIAGVLPAGTISSGYS